MCKMMLEVKDEISGRFKVLFPVFFSNRASSVEGFIILAQKREIEYGEPITISVERYGAGTHYVMKVRAPVAGSEKIEYYQFDTSIAKKNLDEITAEKNYVRFLLRAASVKVQLELRLGRRVKLIDIFGNTLSEEAIEAVYDKADKLGVEGGSEFPTYSKVFKGGDE